MFLKKTLAVGAASMLAFSLVACSSSGSGGSGSGDNYVTAWGSEPQNPLIPANTSETGGGRIVDYIYSGLVYYDAEGNVHNELAESIDLQGEKTYKVTLKDGVTFADGTPVKASNFVNAWNNGMENSLRTASFFEPILGYKDGKEKMEGLKVIDDKTFTIELAEPTSDFPTRLGYSAFYPLPDEALEDLAAFGEKPNGNGPYKLAEWNHNESAVLVPNENYDGPRKAQNDGIKFIFYASLDAAYADLLAGNLDVMEQLPASAFTSFESELGDRSVNKPSAVFQSFTIPEKLEHFAGEEGKLRRQAISLAINREEVTEKIFQNTRTPATDFTSPALPGYNGDIEGNEVLKYDPEKAKKLWQEADKMSKFTGEFTISYNADGGHQPWVDAVSNQLKNNLGIKAAGKAYPDFKSLRDDITKRTIAGAFRSGWQADYPSVGNFLTPLYFTNGSSNDGDYSSQKFDKLMKQGDAAKDYEEAVKYYSDAQKVLFEDLPAIPLWYANTVGGSSENVSDVVFSWKEMPEYHQMTKK